MAHGCAWRLRAVALHGSSPRRGFAPLGHRGTRGIPANAFVGRVRRLAPRADRWRFGRDEGSLAFVCGDFRRVHRMGLIACVDRAAEWRHKAIELAAHDLLQHLRQGQRLTDDPGGSAPNAPLRRLFGRDSGANRRRGTRRVCEGPGPEAALRSDRRVRVVAAPRPGAYFAADGSYKVNRKAVAHARALIDAKQYVLDSDWGESAPTADDENAFLKTHSWDEYALWHLGLTDGANDETKARYAFVYGDLKRVHRTGLIACVYRAAEWRHKSVELAAHRFLQHLDKTSG